ncbi:hypothetical protein [Pseudomonas sp. NPDC089569]|uniref:hypothetical protein n=1 Tax=Pseudomonas sp. NPDC089569 TaxID=3390722 RepID=UPI003CFDD4AF
MMMLFSQVILFFTALTAGKKCAARGYRSRGLVAFMVLEVGYLLMAFQSWLASVILMGAGAWIVLRCINLPRRATLHTSKGGTV